MGFLKNVLNSVTTVKPPEVRTVIFDSDWQDSLETIRQELLGKKHRLR